MKTTPPQRLTETMNVDSFVCGNDELDNWLKNRALKNENRNASRTFVVCQNNQVIAYYSLVVGGVDHIESPSKLRRNMPNPIPIMLLGRLAIDLEFQGKGFGQALLKDAILRTVAISDQAAIKAIMVHAIDIEAKAFYEKAGFYQSPSNPMTLFLGIKEVENGI